MYKTKHYSAAETEAFPRIDWFLDWALRGEDRRRREEGGGRKRNKSDGWTVLKCTKSMPFNGDYFFLFVPNICNMERNLCCTDFRVSGLRRQSLTEGKSYINHT